MDTQNNVYKYVSILVVILVVGGIIYFAYSRSNTTDQYAQVTNDALNSPLTTDNTAATAPTELCFAKNGTPNSQGYADKYSLKLDMNGDNVTGELKLLPAEKDSKVGTFSGTVSAVDPKMMARTVDAMWDTMAEGMNNKEQLKIIFGEGTASIGFGEMVENKDGVYIYKDPNNIQYNLSLTDVACSEI